MTYRTTYSFTWSYDGKGRGGGYFNGHTPGDYRALRHIASGTVMMSEVKLLLAGTVAAPCTNLRAYYTNTYLNNLGTGDEVWSVWYPYHRNYANFLFNDGHVTSYKAGKQFTRNTNAPSWRPID